MVVPSTQQFYPILPVKPKILFRNFFFYTAFQNNKLCPLNVLSIHLLISTNLISTNLIYATINKMSSFGSFSSRVFRSSYLLAVCFWMSVVCVVDVVALPECRPTVPGKTPWSFAKNDCVCKTKWNAELGAGAQSINGGDWPDHVRYGNL